MAVMTFTRRQVVDMFPEFLTKRGGVMFPAIDAEAVELGINRLQLVALMNGYIWREEDAFRRERARFRAPYALTWGTLDAHWDALSKAGLAEPVGDGEWRITARGADAAVEYQRRLRAALREAVLPSDAVKRAAGQMTHLASRIPTGAVRTSWLSQRPRAGADEPRADIVDLDHAATALWYFRDDCHVPAWQERGYSGPEFDVLSYVWPGARDVSFTKLPALTSVDALARAMAIKQERKDIERSIAALVKRGDLEREGDSVRVTPHGQRTRDEIEEDTDRRYYAIWDLDDAATARVGDDLRAVIDAFPKT